MTARTMTLGIAWLIGICTLVAVTAPAQACVSDRIVGQGNSQTIQIINSCRGSIVWSMCINVSGRVARDFPRGVTAPGSTSQYGLWLQNGQRYTYRYTWCPGNCNPSQPNC